MIRWMRAVVVVILAQASPVYGQSPLPPSLELQEKGWRRAIFAGGCFWCMQEPFDKLKGVQKTTVGYAGGEDKDPVYEEVSAGLTGHAEAVEVVYDPSSIPFETLLEVFWRNIDPTALNRQFADVGTQYRTAIFYFDQQQRRLAEAAKDRLQESGRFQKPIVTEIDPAVSFYPAEEYHQDYYKKHPVKYKLYRFYSGRDPFLKKVWARP